jgi:ankyrin repeat protein
MSHIKCVVMLIIIALFVACSENLPYEMNKAAENGDTARVKALLTNGANVDAQDNCMTPLMRATLRGHVDTIKALLIAGANPEIKNDCTHATALNYAEDIHSPEIVRLLFRAISLRRAGNKPTQDDFKGLTNDSNPADYKPLDSSYSELHQACISGDRKIITRLLNSGVDIESKNEIGETPLILAARYNQPGIMILLIDRGANVNAKSELGTPLLYAAEFNFINVVKKMIAKGVDVNAADENGTTPLRTAQMPGNKTIVRLLKKAGAKE